MTVDPYLIAGTGTLRNIVGVTDPVELARLENDLTAVRIAQLEAGQRLAGRFDVAHLRAVHRHIFQDVYDWAGEFRSIAMSKGTDVHPLPQPEYGRTVFDRLATDRFLRGLDHDRFVANLSQVEADLFAWHPFREGNTRSTTTFVGLLARQAGWQINWRDCDPAEMRAALRRSFRASEQTAGRELESVIGSITTPMPPSTPRRQPKPGPVVGTGKEPRPEDLRHKPTRGHPGPGTDFCR